MACLILWQVWSVGEQEMPAGAGSWDKATRGRWEVKKEQCRSLRKWDQGYREGCPRCSTAELE